MVDVLKCHHYKYIEELKQFIGAIPDDDNDVRNMDPDTAVSHHSWQAALVAAGTVCEAVDRVCTGKNRTAFCPIRPPGHHAGPSGVVTCENDPCGSMGFCLLNNVAIAAAYARSMYRHQGIRRVAILDFDVHHGNGTEEIVLNLQPRLKREEYQTPYGSGVHESWVYKPWLDETDSTEVFFASVHGYGKKSGGAYDAWYITLCQTQPSLFISTCPLCP